MSAGVSAEVLIVEDEAAIAELLAINIRHAGMTVRVAHDAEQARREVDQQLPKLVLLDWMLPGQSGVQLARQWRADERTRDLPIIMLTARAAEDDRVAGLDSGADDYLTKPFSIEELLARVRARLRRTGLDEPEDGWLRVSDLAVNPSSREVMRGEQAIHLTAREFDLLLHLIRHPSQVQERRSILDALWGENWVGDDNLLDVYVRYLRKKLEPQGKPTLIQTVRGVGFMLKEGPVR